MTTDTLGPPVYCPLCSQTHAMRGRCDPLAKLVTAGVGNPGYRDEILTAVVKLQQRVEELMNQRADLQGVNGNLRTKLTGAEALAANTGELLVRARDMIVDLAVWADSPGLLRGAPPQEHGLVMDLNAAIDGLAARDGAYEVVAAFEGGPLTRVRHKHLRGHEWGFAYPHLAIGVCVVLNALGERP